LACEKVVQEGLFDSFVFLNQNLFTFLTVL
jgi:hypothetical protein